MTERRVHGRPAAPGFAAGPLCALSPAPAALARAAASAEEEAAVLRAAIGQALAMTLALQARAWGEAAEMLGFQAAMLEDAELARPALTMIAEGAPADAAWERALAAEIADYGSADDPYFRARSVDLQDLRDRVLAALRPGGEGAPLLPGAIVLAADLPLSRFLAIDWARGGAILLTEGSPSSHVAMLARSRGVPMVVGLGDAMPAADGALVLVDAERGEVILDPHPLTRSEFDARARAAAADAADMASLLTEPVHTADGACVAMHLNIVGAAELAALDPAICDGIGLFRTEFLFSTDAGLPGEEAQYAAYRAATEWAAGRPVTIRTLDAGGDKPIPGVTVAGESNPFLGLRGLRLSLRHPALFRVQLRALLRASLHGNLRIMLPMVTVPQELAAARALMAAEIDALAAAGMRVPAPPLGIMIEVPAAAIAIDRFDAAFFSIGSNDLTQYVTAAGRDIASVADLADPCSPAVLRLIEAVVAHGRTTGRDVSLCGDAAGNPALVPALLRTGLRSLSVSPGLLARAKRAVTGVDLAGVGR